MFITIAGELGSGKSTICAALKKERGYEIFSTGDIHRKFAKEKSLSTLELNKQLTDSNEFDNYIDNSVAEYARKNTDKNVVFDSRLAWKFVPESFKVYLIVAPAVAAQRVYATRNTAVESYASVSAAEADLIDRKKTEDKRFRRLYGVDCGDFNNYDLIIDSTAATSEQITALILEKLDGYVSATSPHRYVMKMENGKWKAEN